MQQTTKTGRTWFYIVAIAVIALLIVLVSRSCRQDYGGVLPMPADSLYDTMSTPPMEDTMPMYPDTGLTDTGATVPPPVTPPGMPAATPPASPPANP